MKNETIEQFTVEEPDAFEQKLKELDMRILDYPSITKLLEEFYKLGQANSK